MKGKRIKVSDENWDFFSDKYDESIKKHLSRGDIVVKCASCHNLLIESYLEGSKCPVCNKELVYEEFTPVIKTLNLVRSHKKTDDTAEGEPKPLLIISIIGFILSAILAVYSVMSTYDLTLYDAVIKILDQVFRIVNIAYEIVRSFIETVIQAVTL